MIPLRARQLLEEGSDFRERLGPARWMAAGLALVIVTTLIATDRLSMTIRVGRSGDSFVAGSVTESGVGAADTSTGTGLYGTEATDGSALSSRTPGATAQASSATRSAPGTVEETGGTVAQGVNSCKEGTLEATDRGVEPKKIKLGFVTVSAGINENYTQKLRNISKAWVAELNALGGICGREVEEVWETSTYADPQAQIATCKRLALDHKVFAVVAYASFNTDAGQMCLAKDNKTPLLTWDQLPGSYYKEAGGYLWLSRLNESRMLRNWVRTMRERGYVDPKKHKVGVIYEGTPYDSLAVEKDMLPEMERQGIKPAKTFKTSPNINDSVNEMAAAVLEFKNAGINYVFFVASVFHKEQFIRQAHEQRYWPRYTDSDIKDGCAELLHEFVAPYPGRAYDKTLCVTAHWTGISPNNQAAEFGENINAPFAEYADQVYVKWSRSRYDEPPPTDAEEQLGFGARTVAFMNYIVGGHVVLWAEAAKRAGRNLTRAAWVEEMGRLGRFEQTAFAPHFTFGPNKPDGPDLIAVTQFHAEASNGYEERKFQMLVPHFSAYY